MRSEQTSVLPTTSLNLGNRLLRLFKHEVLTLAMLGVDGLKHLCRSVSNAIPRVAI